MVSFVKKCCGGGIVAIVGGNPVAQGDVGVGAIFLFDLVGVVRVAEGKFQLWELCGRLECCVAVVVKIPHHHIIVTFVKFQFAAGCP